jgi:cytidylate kinase
VSERYHITLRQAEKKTKEIDAKRDHLHEFFGGKAPDHHIFDIVYNFMTMKEAEILESIIRIMELRQMI